MSDEQMNDSTFNRLFILMVIAMTVMTVAIVIIAALASSDVNERLDARSEVENSASIAERLKPVGTFVGAESSDASASAPAAAEPVVLSGAEAYASCGACHDGGIAGAPALGDASAWSARVDQGIETLYKHAIEGFQGAAGYMPPKGGNMALSDESVKAAVDYMVSKVK